MEGVKNKKLQNLFYIYMIKTKMKLQKMMSMRVAGLYILGLVMNTSSVFAQNNTPYIQTAISVSRDG